MAKRTHGLSRTKIYKRWKTIKDRCYREKNNYYKHYGGRGIKMCQEWLDDFMNFYNWAMANGYQDGLTIERIDVNGDYCPENCKWITLEEQALNKTNTRYLTYNGETKTLKEWEEETNLPIRSRLNEGMSIEEAFERPKREHLQVTYKGKTQLITDWCKELNLNVHTVCGRIFDCGWTPEKAFEEPIKTSAHYLTYKGETKSLMEWAKQFNIKPVTLSARLFRYGYTVEEALEKPVK